ncbi:MAG TPA: DUF885 domain-containing protein [Gemmatimonadaceae bacterium]|nr:DUF885 domain-containing protein [Gemmatimonadaceae bacterium]
MNRRSFVQRASFAAASAAIFGDLEACASAGAPVVETTPLPVTDFPGIRDRYFVFHLQRNPVTSTYVGGDGYSPDLADTNARLRDFKQSSIDAEVKFYRDMKATLARIPSTALAPTDLIDYQLMNAQLDFLIRQEAVLRYYQRAVDTYVAEPFRGIDWQIQQMPEQTGGLLGEEADWQLVIKRTLAIPAYLDVAKANLSAGKSAGIIPDKRMVQRDGINGSNANAEYFRNTLPKTAQQFLGARAFAPETLRLLTAAGYAAADAWQAFATWLTQTYDVNEAVDRYAIGEAAYEWRVHNILKDPRSAAELYEYGAQQVALYTAKMVEVARAFSTEAKMGLSFNSDAEKYLGIRKVMEFLSKDSPKNDDQLFKWYRDAGTRAVAYGRENDLFDIPATYRLDVVPTPPVLQSTIDAAYYPAPPFKKTGVGRFYLTPTGNSPAALKENNFSSVADTAVHEGFPGHDWHYRYMNQHAEAITNIRWLTPGAVEDSSSMWTDSMAVEGWGLYSEELMSEPTPKHKYGFYSAGEYLYELQGQLLRAVRIRVDVGLHTGRMSFDQAIDYFTEHVSFYPNARTLAAGDPTAKAIADSATRAIYRYSKWPTQAITYNLGKNTIVQLREACRSATGAGFSARKFHERFMGMGPVPVAYFRDTFLAGCTPTP